jgi:hypothetical protein
MRRIALARRKAGSKSKIRKRQQLPAFLTGHSKNYCSGIVPFKCEPYADLLSLHGEVEFAVPYTDISPGPCPHCGGELEWKASIGGLETPEKTHFFQCKGCNHVHTVEKKPSGSDANHY